MNKYLLKELTNLTSLEEAQYINMRKTQIENIIILPFYINNNAQLPCLFYGLTTSTHDNTSSMLQCLQFIEFECDMNKIDINDIMDGCNNLFKKMLEKTECSYAADFEGFKFKNGTLFAMYRLNMTHANLITMKNREFALVSISEILNEKMMGTCVVHETVVDFFSKNIELCVLHNESNSICETPCVLYSYSPISKIEYDAFFGAPPTRINNQTQNIFLFGDYESVRLHVQKLNDVQNIKYGLIRNAIFLKKSISIINQTDVNVWQKYCETGCYDSAIVVNMRESVIKNIKHSCYQTIVNKRDQFSTLSFNNNVS